MRFHCIVALSAALAFTLPASAASVLGFRTDFETGLFSGFSGEAKLAPLAKVNGSAGAKLGVLLHNDTGGSKTKATTITLTKLGAHESIDLDFLLAVIGKWENGKAATADKFNVLVDGKTVFSKGMAEYGSAKGGVGAAKVVDMGDFAALKGIAHTGSTLRIDFVASGKGWKGGLDESWAIDDLLVTINGVTGPDDCFPAPIPLPSSMHLGLFGVAGVVGIGLVRRRSMHLRD